MNNDEFKYIKVVLEDIGKDVTDEWKSHVLKHNFTGELHRSIKHNVLKSYAGGLQLKITILKRALYLDEGTKPHMPPVSAIKPWANSKGLNEWTVAYSIKKKGTKAYPFLYQFEDIVKKYQKIIVASGIKDVKLMMKKIIDKNK